MRRKKRERVSCKANILCPRCAPACKCAQAFPRIRHAQAHVRVFADPPRAKSWTCGLERVIVRQRGGPEAPRVSLSSASFRFRCRSDPDVFSAPISFLFQRLPDEAAPGYLRKCRKSREVGRMPGLKGLAWRKRRSTEVIAQSKHNPEQVKHRNRSRHPLDDFATVHEGRRCSSVPLHTSVKKLHFVPCRARKAVKPDTAQSTNRSSTILRCAQSCRKREAGSRDVSREPAWKTA